MSVSVLVYAHREQVNITLYFFKKGLATGYDPTSLECVSSPGQELLLCFAAIVGSDDCTLRVHGPRRRWKDDQRARWVQQGLRLVKLTLLMFSGEMRSERGGNYGPVSLLLSSSKKLYAFFLFASALFYVSFKCCQTAVSTAFELCLSHWGRTDIVQ